MKEFITPDFIPVFKETRIDTRLTPLDRLVHGTVYWYEQLKDGKCFASNESIANVVGSDNPKSIGNSINKLEKFGYLKCEYEDAGKRTRLSIKFIRKNDIVVPLDNGMVPLVDGTGVPLDNGQNNNNINNNNKREYNIQKDVKYLLNIPEHDIEAFKKKYKVTKSEILFKAESLYNWAGSVGKKYKDYKLFLMGALLRDYGLRELDNSKSKL